MFERLKEIASVPSSDIGQTIQSVGTHRLRHFTEPAR